MSFNDFHEYVVQTEGSDFNVQQETTLTNLTPVEFDIVPTKAAVNTYIEEGKEEVEEGQILEFSEEYEEAPIDVIPEDSSYSKDLTSDSQVALMYCMKYILDGNQHCLSVGFDVKQNFPVLIRINSFRHPQDEVVFTEEEWGVLAAVNVEHKFRNFFRKNQHPSEYNDSASQWISLTDSMSIKFIARPYEKVVELKQNERRVLLKDSAFADIFLYNPLINHHARRLRYLNIEDFYRCAVSTVSDSLRIDYYYAKNLPSNETILFKGELLSIFTIESDISTNAQSYFCLLEIIKLYPEKFVYDVRTEAGLFALEEPTANCEVFV